MYPVDLLFYLCIRLVVMRAGGFIRLGFCFSVGYVKTL